VHSSWDCHCFGLQCVILASLDKRCFWASGLSSRVTASSCTNSYQSGLGLQTRIRSGRRLQNCSASSSLRSVSIAKYEPFYNMGPSTSGDPGSDARSRRRVRPPSGPPTVACRRVVRRWICLLWNRQHIARADHDPLAAKSGAYVGYVTGTFMNKNTAATYFGSCAAIWLVILSERIRNQLPKGPLRWKHFFATFPLEDEQKCGVRLFGILPPASWLS